METVVSGSDIHAERVAVCDVEAHGKHALTFSSICLYGFGKIDPPPIIPN